MQCSASLGLAWQYGVHQVPLVGRMLRFVPCTFPYHPPRQHSVVTHSKSDSDIRRECCGPSSQVSSLLLLKADSITYGASVPAPRRFYRSLRARERPKKSSHQWFLWKSRPKPPIYQARRQKTRMSFQMDFADAQLESYDPASSSWIVAQSVIL
jgi:hypothetical protein